MSLVRLSGDENHAQKLQNLPLRALTKLTYAIRHFTSINSYSLPLVTIRTNLFPESAN